VRIIYDWCRAWLLHGQQLYAGADARTDYPPNAIVLFAPLALVPRQWVVPAWAAVTLILTPLYAYLVVRSTSPRIRVAAVVPMLLFFCWGGVRTFLEFSRLSVTLGFLAVLAADSRPVASGVCLGLALAKPHIAGPIMLWVLVTRRTRVAAVAILVVVAGFVVYCLRADVGPIAVLNGYGRILLSLYSVADAGLVGRTSLLPWWRALGGDSTLGNVLWGVGAGLLLLVPCVMAMRATDKAQARGSAVLALFCLWSLLTIYHIGNNLVVLMLPSFVFLLAVDDPATARWRLCAVVVIQAAMMLDIPVHLAPWVPDHGPAFIFVRDFDRMVVLLTFALVAAVCHRLTRGRA
jgi:hypothetical protein